MKLDRFCFILPPESTDLGPFDFDKPVRCRNDEKARAAEDYKPVRARHGCGNQVAFLIHGLVSKVFGKDHRDRTAAFVDTDGVQLFDAKVGNENPRKFGFAELYIGTKGFSEGELLGSGGFGKVYRAVLPGDGSVAAVKIVAEKGDRFEKTFEAELAAVAHLRHRNLVRLRGWCTHENQLLLVYDYMPNRSLDRVLFRNPNGKAASAALSWERRRRIIGGLASGLHYLHEGLENQIIHRDVKTSNVMLDSDFSARLGDFGLARWVEHKLEYGTVARTAVVSPALDDGRFRLAETMTRIGGTIGYLPPESFQRGSLATAKSDVFSFGVVALEVASGRRAVDLAYPDEKIVLLDWVRRLADEGKLVETADKRLQPGSFDRTGMEQLVHLGLLCTVQNPMSRPTMKWVVEVVSGNVVGKLPGLPSFRSQPLYIAFSSDSNPSTSNVSTTSSSSNTASTRSEVTGIASVSSKYLTANTDTVFATAADPDEEKLTTTTTTTTTAISTPQRFVIVETPREIPYNALLAATANFSESRKVAELDFGTAYRGRLNNRDVLVKKLGMSKCPALRARFSDELRNLGRLRHRNLVQLRGWCTELGEMIVVYDYSATHLLSHHANPRSNQPLLTWRHRYSILKSLAGAILYLHEEWDEQVIHRNITSSTVVLDSDLNPRLSGFALAEFLTRNDHGHKAAARSGKSVRGIFGYVSPEYIESGEATTAADVYSFGVVVLEVVCGEAAVDFRRKEVLLVRRVVELEREIGDLVDWRLNGEYDYGEMVRLVKLGIACTRSDPNLRPSIREIVSILDGNDGWFKEISSDGIDEWKCRNSTSMSMIRRMKALGIH